MGAVAKVRKPAWICPDWAFSRSVSSEVSTPVSRCVHKKEFTRSSSSGVYTAYAPVFFSFFFFYQVWTAVRVTTCTDMIVSDNEMRCFGLRWDDGRRNIMGLGAKGVSNHLMEAVAGMNMSMTNSLLSGNVNHWAMGVYCKTEETKWGSKDTSRLGMFLRPSKR